jgi:PAS domain S-box-containing protein
VSYISAASDDYPILVSIVGVLLLLQTIAIFVLARRLFRHKQLQRELSDSETRFRMVFESSREALGVFVEKKLSFVNPAWTRTFGYKHENQIVGASMATFVHPVFHPMIEALDSSPTTVALTDPAPHHFIGVRPDGQEFEAELSRSFFRWKSDTHHLVVVRDVTVSRRTAAALQETQRQRDLALEAGGMGTWHWDRRTNLAAWSPTQEALFGMRPGTYDGSEQMFLARVQMDDRQRVRDCVQRSAETEEEYKQEYRVILPDGSERWIAAQGRSVLNEDGELVALTGVSWDLTEKRLAQMALERSEAELRLIMDSTPALLGYVDQDYRFLRNNKAFEDWFGVPVDHLKGRAIEEVFGWNVAEVPKPDPQVIAAGTSVTVGTYVMKPGLGRRHVDITYTPHLSRVGRIEGLVVLGVDVTERKQTEEALNRQADELARSNADLQQFAYVTSHDLQEPLRMIVAYSQLLSARYTGKLDADADEFLLYLTDAGSRMSAMIRDLLSYSRVTNAESIAATGVDMNVAVERALGNLQMSIEACNANVTFDKLPTIKGNPVQMVQVYQNLIGNAIKYRSEAQPHIHLSAQTAPEGWIFGVRDNGIGIAPEYQERVFGLFKRLHGRDVPGTGIGLAISRKIVERHGGKMWVESGEGKGSTFFFLIPDSQPTDSQKKNASVSN